MTTQGMVASRFGGPDVLEARSLEARAPGPGEVRIRHAAIGVNYIDVYVRKGEYRLIEPPAPIGMEAAGVVLDVGDGVAHLLPGDRVAYACAPPGAYVGVRTLPANQVVVLPDEVDEETAAALMLKGMTAEYLLHRTHRVRSGETVLVHAAAGGVGLAAVPMGQGAGRPGDRHRLHRRQGPRRACRGLRRRHRRPRLPLRRFGARRHRPAAAPT